MMAKNEQIKALEGKHLQARKYAIEENQKVCMFATDFIR